MKRHAIRAVGCAVVAWLAVVSASLAQVLINEVHPHPAAIAGLPGHDPARLEFLELFNAGSSAVDLSGWSLSPGVDLTFPRGTWLGANEYLVVAKDPVFLREHGPAIPPGVQVLGWTTGDLAVGEVQLVDASKPSPVRVDRLVFAEARPRRPEGRAAGASLELVNPGLRGTTPRAWRESLEANGTPGARNSRFSSAPIVLHEAPRRGPEVAGLSRFSVTFSEDVKGVVASDLTVDGRPALGVEGAGAGPYVFVVDAPSARAARVTLESGSIANLAGIAFEGDSWDYILAPLATVLSMPDDASGGTGAAVQVPLFATPGDGILGIDMTLQYDPTVLLATNMVASGIAGAQGFALVRNLNTPGTIIASEYATQSALSGSGEIARVYFNVVGSPGATSVLRFARASINEGAIPATLDHGLFTVTCAGAANGTPCNDGNPCTQTDTCQAGVCSGNNPVTCTAIDPCHDPGECDPGTGLCTNPPKPDGTPCEDGNLCTQTDSCQAGACTGGIPVTCTPSDSCHDVGTCEPSTGLCTNPARPDGFPCDDGNACTASDQCAAGTCVGTSIQAPAEITNVSLQPDRVTLVWDPVAGAGTGTVYDGLRGNLSALPVGPGGADEACFANNVAATTASDTVTPAPATGFWYLVRAENVCSKGSFGFEERRGLPPVERVTTSCP